MAKSILFAVVGFLAVSSASALTNCTRNGDVGGSENPAKGYAAPGLCAANQRCLQTNTGFYQVVSQFACFSCASNCDCGIGQYCSNTNPNNTNYGTCQSFAPKLNTPCTTDITSSSQLSIITSNVDSTMTAMTNASKMFCGIYETATTGNVTVWAGTCIAGLCKECNAALLSGTASDVSQSLVGSASSEFSNFDDTLQLFCAAKTSSPSMNALGYDTTGPTVTSNSYLGPPRYCKNFQVVQAGSSQIADMLKGSGLRNQVAYPLLAFVVAAIALIA